MSRISKLLDLIQENELSAILIRSSANIFYFTGFRGSGFLLVPLDGRPKLYTYPIDYELAQIYACKEVDLEKLRMSSTIETIVEELPDAIKSRMGFDVMDAQDYLKIIGLLESESLKPASDLIWKLRMTKDSGEVERIRKASEIASRCMELASDILEDGVMESEVKAEILEEMLKLGAEKAAFDLIIASGPRSSIPHGAPGDRAVKRGDVVVVDLGAVYDGYCSDMTRTYYIGSDPPEEVEKIYDVVLDVKSFTQDSIKPWTLSSSLYESAYSRFAKRGYEKYVIHGLGHGVGIEVHEPPRLSQAGKELLSEGMTITIEPGIYIPKKFGVRIEDTVLIEKDGVKVLTSSPYELAIA